MNANKKKAHPPRRLTSDSVKEAVIDPGTESPIVKPSIRDKYELRKLVSQNTAKNRHSATEWGSEVAKSPDGIRAPNFCNRLLFL